MAYDGKVLRQATAAYKRKGGHRGKVIPVMTLLMGQKCYFAGNSSNRRQA